MKNENSYVYEDVEQAVYTDANAEADIYFRKAMLYLVLIATAAASLLGIVYFIMMHTSAHNKAGNTDNSTVNIKSEDTAPGAFVPVETEDPRRKILIDAGHGGYDPGAEGTETGITESQVNLEIVKRLEKIFEDNGYLVMLTRYDEKAIAAGKNEDMAARCAIIERSGADIFISIHQNSLDNPSVSGCEVYYHDTRPDSRQLAECVEKELAAVPGAKPSRGVKTYGHMLTKFLRYSILVECGFLTNRDEEANLTDPDYQQLVAEAIFHGVENFYADYYKEY